jgi:hypothetical protein
MKPPPIRDQSESSQISQSQDFFSKLLGVVRLAGTQKGRKQKGHAMRTNTMSYAMALAAGALGVAGAVAIATASPSWAAPVAPDTTAVRTAASNQLIDVQYHRRGYYGRGYGRGYYGRGYGRRYYGRGYYRRGYGRGYYGRGYGRRYYGRGYYRRGYGYPYAGYAYPNYYPYAYPSPYLGFGFGWGGW